MGDSSSGFEGSEDLNACECGYVSGDEDYDEDYDEDSDEYFMDKYEGDSDCSEEDYGDLSRSFRHYVGCPAKAPFRLLDLPLEVRLMIFRLAMPDDRTLPLHSRAHDWNDRYDPHYGIHVDNYYQYTSYEDLNYRPPKSKRPEAIPSSLFKVEEIEAEALSVFNNEVYFRMDVLPFGVRARGARTGSLENFDNHGRLAQWPSFKSRRNYHLNIKSNAWRVTITPQFVTEYRDPRNFEDGIEKIKEWLRLIADELSRRKIIQNLTITAPCICALRRDALRREDYTPEDEAVIVDLFAPLKRICVPNAVKISLHDDAYGRDVRHACSFSDCLDLARMIQASIGRLDGERLKGREAKWKRVKMLFGKDRMVAKKDRRWGEHHWAEVCHIWDCLNRSGNDFNGAVRSFHGRREIRMAQRQARKGKLYGRQEEEREAGHKNDVQFEHTSDQESISEELQ